MIIRNKHLAFGASLAGIAVALGAFGAHALKEHLLENNATAIWETAVRYQMWHALAILLCCALKSQIGKAYTSSICFTLGTVLFSGSLYGLALGGPRWLGPITPLGGLLLLIGWALLTYNAIRNTDTKSD